MEEMKTLTINNTEFEIVDAKARKDIEEYKENMGETDISGIGDGTLTGAIAAAVLREKLVLLTGEVTLTFTAIPNYDYWYAIHEIDYPEGFTKDNCIFIGMMAKGSGISAPFFKMGDYGGGRLTGLSGVVLRPSNVTLTFHCTPPESGDTLEGDATYKLLLYKLD